MMNLFTQRDTASAIFILALVIASGLYISKFRVKGISLGTTWILFMGILLGHLGLRINPVMLSFIKDFGLILFVFAIGLQVGPGFFHSFRKDGLSMNLLSVALVTGSKKSFTLIAETEGCLSSPASAGGDGAELEVSFSMSSSASNLPLLETRH